jgi:metal-responsive CopG/Arc/MetJ family transcriptional regulator
VIHLKRLNITIPEEINEEIKSIPNKSSFISEAIKEKIDKMNKEKLDKLLIEGYQATTKEDKMINDEWENITLEGWK